MSLSFDFTEEVFVSRNCCYCGRPIRPGDSTLHFWDGRRRTNIFYCLGCSSERIEHERDFARKNEETFKEVERFKNKNKNKLKISKYKMISK